MANLFRNGVLARLLRERPNLRWLMLHNIDTVGTALDPVLLGNHITKQSEFTFEVIPRRLEDRGGGLARVNGRTRLVEGLAMPRDEDEFELSYYNTLTTWIDLQALFRLFGLNPSDVLEGRDHVVSDAIRALANRLPTYITIKEVKKRWGNGHEDVYPVSQFEKLWGDISTLSEGGARFVSVARNRGQQLKEQSQLDGWWRDGSAQYLEEICRWGRS